MKIKSVLFFVDDLDRAVEFYSQILGFVQTGELALQDDMMGVLLSSADQGTSVCLAQVRDSTEFKSAIILCAENCIKEYTALKSKGIEFPCTPKYGPSGMTAYTNDCLRDYYILKRRSFSTGDPYYINEGLGVDLTDHWGNKYMLLENRNYQAGDYLLDDLFMSLKVS